MTSGRTYTRRLDKVLNDLDDEFKSICSASSFTRKLEQLKSSARSARPSVMKELYVMLDNIGIEYEKGKDYAYYEQLVNYAYILDTEEIEERMLHSLNKKYQGKGYAYEAAYAFFDYLFRYKYIMIIQHLKNTCSES